MQIFNFFTLILCLIPTALSVYSIIKVGIKPFTIFQVFFFFLFVFPIFLDIIFGSPEYLRFPGFYDSQKSNLTSIIYNFFIISISCLNWLFRGKEIVEIRLNHNIKYYDFFLMILVMLPFLVFLFLPDYSYYYIYGGGPARGFNEIAAFYHGFINIFTFISVIVCSFLIIRYINKSFLLALLILLIALLDFWLNGKRAIVLIFLFFLGLFYLIKNKNIKSIIFSIFLCGIFYGYSNWYQGNVRDYGDKVTFKENYESIRIDYFRDQRVKMAIYAQLNPSRIKILDYPGQSLLFTGVFFIPRDIWLNKPYPYAQYFTSALFYSEPKLWGWSMTTSIYDEFIANFSWYGILLFQLILILFFKSIMSIKSNYFKLFAIFLVLLLLVVHMVAFMMLYIFGFIWYLKIRFSKMLKGD